MEKTRSQLGSYRNIQTEKLCVQQCILYRPSTRSLSPDALALLRTLSRRSGRTVPPPLLEEASWATPVFASFARMSLSLSMRRSLAYRLREAGVTESVARDLARQPAPVPEDPDRAFDAPESA